MDETIEALLEAHDEICREIGRAELNETDEWSEGHTNGLKEGRNSVEAVIHEHFGNEQVEVEWDTEAVRDAIVDVSARRRNVR